MLHDRSTCLENWMRISVRLAFPLSATVEKDMVSAVQLGNLNVAMDVITIHVLFVTAIITMNIMPHAKYYT